MKMTAFILSTCFLFSFANATETNRKLAQVNSCLPLGQEFILSSENEFEFDLKELRMLRNSIYAQYGYQFADKEVQAEMVKRGCVNMKAKFSYSKVSKIDNLNVHTIAAREAYLNDVALQANNFNSDWAKSATSKADRKNLISNNYCFLNNAKQDYVGIINFSGSSELTGMMNIAKPTWAYKMSKKEMEGYDSAVKYKTLDTTSANSLNLSTKGTWELNAKGDVQISIGSLKKVNLKISAEENFRDTHILTCAVTK